MQRLMSVMHNQHKTQLHNQSAAPLLASRRAAPPQAFYFQIILLINLCLYLVDLLDYNQKEGEKNTKTQLLNITLESYAYFSTVNKPLG